jgi:potassium-transporting ATPase potassium-binding subunit
MTTIGWIQILVYCAIIVAITPVLGAYMTRVFNGERTFLTPILRPIELTLYSAAGVDEKREQGWLAYTVGMLLFHVGGFLILYGLMRFQALLPFNPADQSAVAPDLSFNTAVSFITNTNWQNYGGESTLSYLVQMLGLTHQNFLSAATGIVLAVALIRGFARHSVQTIGNFWVDITRCTLYILIPICVPFALFLVWQGMPQTLGAYVDANTLEGAKQTIAVGPVASQIAIKMLGTNGGGFFNANASHPFENPTALSNYLQIISIFAIGASLTNVFGRMVGNQRQGWAILAVMGVLFISGVALAYWAEAHGNDIINAMGLSGGNMEGKEVRFGIVASALFAVITTAASCGAVNAMHDSFTALGGMVPLINIQLGRNHRRRRWCWHVWYAALCHYLDFRRRPDGRPDARIRGQEDRGQGSQDGHARHPGLASDVSRLDSGSDGQSAGGFAGSEQRAPRVFGDSLSLHVEYWQ